MQATKKLFRESLRAALENQNNWRFNIPSEMKAKIKPSEMKPKIKVLEERNKPQQKPIKPNSNSNPKIFAKRKLVDKSRKITKKPIYITDTTVASLGSMLKVSYKSLASRMEDMGFKNTEHNHVLNAETASLIAMEYGHEPIVENLEKLKDLEPRPCPDDWSVFEPRPPVVTIMGHVDHGKTTLLDSLRKTSVVESEHGGITQHIGAFSVLLESGKRITFLDTPGHAAFSAMRQRGANVTDIVVLIVAADDGVMPQTIEAIKHAQAAQVPIVVAINKCDKHGVNVEDVKQNLLRYDVVLEEYGGEIPSVLVSGLKGTGLDELEETILAIAAIKDFRGDATGPVEGVIIESKTTKAKGHAATVLVKRGTLKVGDIIVAGNHWAKVRSLSDTNGLVKEAGPSYPVEVTGWKSCPEAGCQVLQAETEQVAKLVIENRIKKANFVVQLENIEKQNEKLQNQSDEQVQVKDRVLNIIVKGDVHGSLEAIQDVINGLPSHKVRCSIVSASVGQVNESDVELAVSTNSIIVSFNTQIISSINQLAKSKRITLENHQVIYTLIDSVKNQMAKLLPPEIDIKVEGEAEILKLFEISNQKKTEIICGCKIQNGKITRTKAIRVIRNNEIIHQGRIKTFKHHKKDITEGQKGLECGIALADYEAVQVGDIIQCISQNEIPATIE